MSLKLLYSFVVVLLAAVLALPVTGETSAQGAGAPSSPDLAEAVSLTNQAESLLDQGKYREALERAKRALGLREKALGKDNADVADCLMLIGQVQIKLVRYADAEGSFRRAVAIYEKVFLPDSARLCLPLEYMAWVSHGLGDAPRAEKLFLRILAIKEKAYGPEHVETAATLEAIGLFYMKAAMYEKSLASFRRALAIKEKSLGPTDKAIAGLLEQCACGLTQLKRVSEAEALRERAFSIRYPVAAERKRHHVPGGVLQGEAIKRVEPKYPPSARQARLAGVVVVEIKIDERGFVESATVKCGPDLLSAAAREAARQWRFKPTLLRGQPVKVIGSITFNFTF
jgi:TonB family protein